jgi:hypothetical protein
MNNNLDPSPSASVQLNGFAPAAGSSSSPVVAVVSASSASSTPENDDAAVAGGAGGKKTTTATTTTATTTTATTKRAAKKRGPKGGGSSSSPPASFSEGSDFGGGGNNGLSDDAFLRPLPDVGPDFEPMGLPQVRYRLGALLEKLPRDLPDPPPPIASDIGVVATAGASPAVDGNEEEVDPRASVRSFASELQIAVEEYNLLLSLVSSATYRWGVDRSGASQQNLSVMSAELQQCQDVISNVVSSRLSNVLCPAVDIMVGEVEIIGGGGGNGDEDGDGGREMDASPSDEAVAPPPGKKRKLTNDDEDRRAVGGGGGGRNERRINRYIRPLVDPSYVHLCDCILARNAAMIRHTVATSIHTAQRVIGDYLNAMKKDTSHEAGKGGYY